MSITQNNGIMNNYRRIFIIKVLQSAAAYVKISRLCLRSKDGGYSSVG